MLGAESRIARSPKGSARFPGCLRNNGTRWVQTTSRTRRCAAPTSCISCLSMPPRWPACCGRCRRCRLVPCGSWTWGAVPGGARSPSFTIPRRVKLLESLLDALAADGTCMLIEPALRETTRSLHEVRDRLVAAGLATVYSPCLHERPCPALAHPDDWCHEERPWAPPPMLQAVDSEVGFIKDALKFSYLLLRKDGRTIAERRPDVYRVVSEVMAMKGDRRVWLCNETGRPLVGRLDKARSDANAALERWHRGAIVRVEHIERRAGIGRIENSTRVELIRPVEG